MVSGRRKERDLEALHRKIMLLMSDRDSETTLGLVRTLLEKAKQANSIKYLGAAYGIKGYVYYGLNELKLAIDNFEKSLNFYSKKSEKFFAEIKQTNNSLGILYCLTWSTRICLSHKVIPFRLSTAKMVDL